MGIDLHAACRSTPVACHFEGQQNKQLLFHSATAVVLEDRGDPPGSHRHCPRLGKDFASKASRRSSQRIAASHTALICHSRGRVLQPRDKLDGLGLVRYVGISPWLTTDLAVTGMRWACWFSAVLLVQTDIQAYQKVLGIILHKRSRRSVVMVNWQPCIHLCRSRQLSSLFGECLLLGRIVEMMRPVPVPRRATVSLQVS